MMPIKLKVTIELLTPLHVGGDPGEDVNTSYILRGADKQAYYPGTAFKGKVRHYALQLQKELRQADCLFPEVCDCDVCRLFGGEGNARGSLFFSNFHTAGKQAIDLRAGNSIDRFRRVAEDEKLFTTESAAISALEGYITGNANEKDVDLLKASIKLIQQIGGNTSRGFGWVKGTIDVIVEDQPKEYVSGSDNRTISCVRVTLTPTSPLLIGTHTTQSNFRDTQFAIPGAVMRAAVARAICEQDGTADPSEEGIENDLPTDMETRFPNLRKAFSELRFSTLNADVQPMPFPITTRKCKHHKKHRWVDALVATLKDNDVKCSECEMLKEKGRMDKVEPYEQVEDYLTNRKHPNALRMITSTHSETDKYRGTSRDGRLYTVRAIAPRAASFSGTINGSIDMKELSSLLISPLRVGAMLTSGFGVCEVLPITIDYEEPYNTMLERIEEFNKLVGSSDIFVPITLMSDAIVKLKEPDDGDYIKAYEPLLNTVEDEPDFELESVLTKPRMWRGFDTSPRKREPEHYEKPARFLLQAGSVFVVRIRAKTLDSDSVEVEKLKRIEREGIGEERKDGYGAVRVAHENHIEITLAMKGGQTQ